MKNFKTLSWALLLLQASHSLGDESQINNEEVRQQALACLEQVTSLEELLDCTSQIDTDTISTENLKNVSLRVDLNWKIIERTMSLSEKEEFCEIWGWDDIDMKLLAKYTCPLDEAWNNIKAAAELILRDTEALLERVSDDFWRATKRIWNDLEGATKRLWNDVETFNEALSRDMDRFGGNLWDIFEDITEGANSWFSNEVLEKNPTNDNNNQ